MMLPSRVLLCSRVILVGGGLVLGGCSGRDAANQSPLGNSEASDRRQGPSEAVADEDGIPQVPPQLYIGSSVVAPSRPDAPYLPGMVIIRLGGGETIQSVNWKYGTRSVGIVPDTDFVVLEAQPGIEPWELCDDMEDEGDCAIAEPIFVTETPESNQGTIPFYEGGHTPGDVVDQEAMDRIGLSEAAAIANGNGVVIAVVDTGIDPNHPAFGNSISPLGYDFIDEDNDPLDFADGINQDGDSQVDEGAGHGTHVSGIIHAIAPGATIIPLRALNTEGAGSSVSVTRAIRYAKDLGVDVINLSLGLGATSHVIKEAIQDAEDAGILVVASAGNENRHDPWHFPASMSQVMTIAATDALDEKASFSSYSSRVSVSAPGAGILSAGLNNGYAVWSGTSMSVPMVAGAAALQLQLNPGEDLDDLVSDIEAASDPLHFYGFPWNDKMGEGRLNLFHLVTN